MQAPSVTMARDRGNRFSLEIRGTAARDSSTPATTKSARGSGDGGSFIQTSARRLCQTLVHTSGDATVARRRPVSLNLTLVPYRMLKTPVYHHVRAAKSATPAANVARYATAGRRAKRAINATRNTAKIMWLSRV